MPFIQKTKKQEKQTKSQDELFELYMIEIGQYTKTPEWQLIQTWEYIKASKLYEDFRDWLKR